jgi:hypothetical protein
MVLFTLENEGLLSLQNESFKKLLFTGVTENVMAYEYTKLEKRFRVSYCAKRISMVIDKKYTSFLLEQSLLRESRIKTIAISDKEMPERKFVIMKTDSIQIQENEKEFTINIYSL